MNKQPINRIALVVIALVASVIVLAAPAAHAGRVLVSSIGSGSILYYDARGAFIGTYVPQGSGGLLAPTGLTIGPDEVCT